MSKIKVNGEFFAWQQEMTITELLKSMEYPYHPLAIKVDGKVISPDDYDKEQLPQNSEVQIIRIISGG